MGETHTAWLPWPSEIGNNFIRWWTLRVGQQVVLVSPSCELNKAAIVGHLYGGGFEAPADDETLDLIQFDDSTKLQNDSSAHCLTVGLGTVKSMLIKALSNSKMGVATRLNCKGHQT